MKRPTKDRLAPFAKALASDRRASAQWRMDDEEKRRGEETFRDTVRRTISEGVLDAVRSEMGDALAALASVNPGSTYRTAIVDVAVPGMPTMRCAFRLGDGKWLRAPWHHPELGSCAWLVGDRYCKTIADAFGTEAHAQE